MPLLADERPQAVDRLEDSDRFDLTGQGAEHRVPDQQVAQPAPHQSDPVGGDERTGSQRIIERRVGR